MSAYPFAVPVGRPVVSLAGSDRQRSEGLYASITPTTHSPSPGGSS
jgi:hypothetical protein